ncbi:MAG: gliding motility-associated C-terminal domain-containing protein [Flavobacteriales bacterium]|nr:gliding motility-associated C-terminal domain-containing protein [Flavobacteriales bacterium]
MQNKILLFKRFRAFLPILLLGLYLIPVEATGQVRFWVGGTGNWQDQQHWSMVSGGRGGASLPSRFDDVVFDDKSFTQDGEQVVVEGVASCASFVWRDRKHKAILSGDSKSTLKIYGGLQLSESLVNQYNGGVSFYNANYAKLDSKPAGSSFKGKTDYIPAAFSAGPGGNSPDSVCPLTVVMSYTAPSCNGYKNGVVRVDSVIGETGPLTYQWLYDGSTADSLTGLGPGTYTVKVTDLGVTPNCQTFASKGFIDPAELVIFATPPPEDATCFGVCDGEGSVTAIDGTSPYSYLWSSGCTMSTCTGLCAADYTITVTDANGCNDQIGITISQPGLMAANGGKSNISCSGACDGYAYVIPSGGTTPYTFVWSDATTNDTLFNLCPGAYNVTVTDKNGCQDIASLNISEPLPLTTTPHSTNVSCGGLCDGGAGVDVQDGTAPYTYVWAPGGETTDTISSLCLGAYSVTVTDNNGCTSVENYNISEPPVLTASITDTTHVACFSNCSGIAIVTPAGGTPPFTYLWSNAATDSTASSLCVGNYDVTITDNNGCQTTASVTITQPSNLTASTTPTNASCNGTCNGQAIANPSGGTSPYTYLWSNGKTTATVTGLCAGNFTVTVTDNNGCTTTATAGIAQPTALTGGVTASTDATCGGSCNGTATMTVAGGTMPYTYLWSDGQTTATATGLCAAGYTVTATDNNGCTVTGNITINEPSVLTANITASTNLACYNVCTGTATVLGGGGTLPYTYLWTNGQTTANANNLCSGNNAVTVTDSKGCTASTSVNLTEPAVYSTVMSKTDPGCGGACDGTATTTPSGGTPGYTYNWSSGCTTGTCTGLCSGWYHVTVTDNNSCTIVDSIQVPVTPIPAMDSSVVSVSCNGVCDGSGTFTASAGTAPYDYLWSTGCTTGTCTGLCSGGYTVTVTDATGCTVSATLTVPGLNIVDPNETVTNAQCNAICDGSIILAPSGGAAPYSYVWSNACTGTNCTGLCPGSYGVTVTDKNGCTSNNNFTIGVTNPVTVVASSTEASCNSACNGSVTATPSGGTPPYNYSWSSGCTTATCTGVCAGTYTVTVTGAVGCNSTQTITVTEPTLLTNSFSGHTDVTCFGQCDGGITAGGSGGKSPYTYTWSSGATTATLTGLCANTYYLTVTDVNACEVLDTVVIDSPANLLANEGSVNSSCASADGTVSSAPTGGTSPYTYNWSNGCTQATCTGVSAGSYDLTVTDAAGCNTTANVVVNDNGGPTGEAFISVAPSCNGSCNGQLTVTPIGGTAPYTYVWSNGKTANAITGLCAGNYFVTMTDNNGCSRIASSLLSDPPPISASITDTTHVSCNGLCDGVAIVTPGGGTTPYTYVWSNGQTDSTATGLCAGLVNVTVTDAKSCQTVAALTITEPTLLTTSITDTTHISCNGNCDGDATVTPSGGMPPYTYLWGNAQTNGTATGLCAGAISVTVTDANGCQNVESVTITEPLVLTAAVVVIVDATCNGDCDGRMQATGSGGLTPYSYLWTNGQTTRTATGLCAGAMDVTITDANGCTATAGDVISEPTLLTMALSGASQNACYGECSGIASFAPSGGTPPYTYLWSGSQTDSIATGLCAGSYTLTITDANGCNVIDSTTITEPTVFAVDSGVVNAACGSCNGIGIALPTGGVSPYSYAWSNGCTSGTCTGLCVGSFNVTVTDNNGCTATTLVLVSNTNGPNNSGAAITNVSCNGLCNGQIALSPSGGQPPYTYVWDDPGSQTGATATGLCAGTVSVSITDNKGCTLPVILTVTQPTVLAASFTDSTEVDCNGNCTGSATITPSGGTAPYTYLWDDPSAQTDSIATGLCAGTFGVTVTDAKGCQTTGSIDITEPPSLIPSISASSNLQCNGVCVGTASPGAFGGTPPYGFSWSNGTTDSVATGLCAGVFTVTITDANGCAGIDSVTISEPSVITGNPSTSAATCGVCDGSITLAPSGGTPGYTYQWDDASSQTSATATGLCAAIYNVTITDINGCTSTKSVVLNNNGGPTGAGETVTDATCNGNCDGQVALTPAGGNPPYLYLWNDAASHTTSSITGLCAGTYNVTVSDALGCILPVQVTVSEASLLAINFSGSTQVDCNGNCNGTAIAAGSGGTPPFTFLWNNGQTDSIATGLCAGKHTVTVTDANTCTSVDSITITEPVVLAATITDTTHLSCNGGCIGTATVTPSGGTAPFTYVWSDAQTDSTATGLCAQGYTVTVTDVNGCTTMANVTIVQPLDLSTTSSTIGSSCGACDGSATVTPAGGTAPYAYLWDDISAQTNSTATGLCAGTYKVTVTDAAGCTAQDTILLIDNGGPTDAGETVTNITCSGNCDGEILLSPTGGNAPYTYLWNSGETTIGITGLCSGNYIVSITDALGCVLPVSINVIQPSLLTASFTDSTYINCFGNCTGMATITPAGGTAPYSYLWTDGQTDSAATGLCAMVHSVTVTDAGGCTFVDSISLLQPNQLIADITDSIMISCNGVCIGSGTVTPSGGTSPYTYLWNDGQTDSIATGLCAGVYKVTVTDAMGCTSEDSLLIFEPAVILANSSSIDATCGVCDGVVIVSPTGGTPGYTYLWSDALSQTTDSAKALCSGIYTVTITDALGCTLVEKVPLSDAGGPSVDTVQVQNVGCNGACSGGATVVVSGGLPPYTYLWDDASSQTTATATGLCKGTYFVIVTDANGCKVIPQADVSETTVLTGVFLDTSHVSCYQDCDGSVRYAMTGGSPPYTFSWSNGQTDSVATGLCAGTYKITVTDSKTCMGVDSVTITEPGAITLSVTAIPNVVCLGDSAVLTAVASGGAGGFTYIWNDALSSTAPSIVVSPLDTFFYQVTVTDANGCQIGDGDSVAVISPGQPTLPADTGICRGDSLLLIGQIDGPGSYLWTTTGNGVFLPDSVSPNVIYLPDSTDSNIEIYLSAVGACQNITDTMKVSVGIKAIVTVSIDQEVPIGTKYVTVSGTIVNATSGVWTSNGTGIFSPSDQFLNPTYYPSTKDYDLDSLVLTLTSSGANGCAMASDSVVIKFIEVTIPNVFTPYPESPGYNDVFFIRGLPQGASLEVFNRWGIKVFQSDYYRNDWDAEGVKGDTYYYILTWGDKYWKGYVQVIKKDYR